MLWEWLFQRILLILLGLIVGKIIVWLFDKCGIEYLPTAKRLIVSAVFLLLAMIIGWVVGYCFRVWMGNDWVIYETSFSCNDNIMVV